MKSQTRNLLLFLLVLALGLLIIQPVQAMHIMEGFLPPVHAAIYFVISLPLFIYGLKRLGTITRNHPQKKLLIALAGAFVFLLSSLKLPAMTGSCSHPTGVGLGTVLLGPAPMFVLGTIVLIFQALLLAHGGLTTLGANAFSMAIVGPLVGFAVYKALKKSKANDYLAVFAAAALADLVTYVVTSIQLGLAFPGENLFVSIGKYMAIFAVTQVPIAIIEGILTVLIYSRVKEVEGGTLLYEKVH